MSDSTQHSELNHSKLIQYVYDSAGNDIANEFEAMPLNLIDASGPLSQEIMIKFREGLEPSDLKNICKIEK